MKNNHKRSTEPK